jgi:hypothetical protein
MVMVGGGEAVQYGGVRHSVGRNSRIGQTSGPASVCVVHAHSVVALRGQRGQDAATASAHGVAGAGTAAGGAGAVPPPALCVVCGLPGRDRCSKCHLATYCCRAHQIVDWKVQHKATCRCVWSCRL